MPDDILESTEEIKEVAKADPIEEAREADIATEEETAKVQGRVATEPALVEPIEEGAGGESDELKTLKAELTRKTAELYKAQGQIQQILPMLQQRKEGAADDVPLKNTPEQIEASLKKFVNDPDNYHDPQIRRIVGELLKAEIDPLRGEISASRADSAISAFMMDHPELGKEGERKIGAILDENPHLTAIGNSASAARIRASLDDALGRLIRQDPKGYAASLEAAEKGPDQNIQNAKNAAGGLGNKEGSAVTTPQTNRDEFDEVLDLNRHTEARYQGGAS